MEAKDIGFCALFRGPDSIVKAVKRPRDEIQAFISLVSYDSIPCLEKLRKTLRDVAMDIGLERTCSMLAISEDVLSLIIAEDDTSIPDQLPAKNNKKSKPTVAKAVHQEEFVQPENALEELKSRVVRLYSGKVKTRVIMALYEIRNPCLIHSWGNWERSEAGAKLRQMKETILNLRAEGKNDEEIAGAMNIKIFKVQEIMGEIKRSKLIYTGKDIHEALSLHKNLKNKKKVAKELGVSPYTLDEWILMGKLGEVKTVFDTEDGTSPLTVLNALETFYLTKSVEKAAKQCKLDILRVSGFVEKFEARMKEFTDFSSDKSKTPAKNGKTGEKPESDED